VFLVGRVHIVRNTGNVKDSKYGRVFDEVGAQIVD